jgi:hypothetical protein
MVATRADKRASIASRNPLIDRGILKQVLSYSGAGEFIFYAPISKLWLACYRAVPAHEVMGKDTACCKQDFKALPKMTLRRAVYASAARVKVAHAAGLRFDADGKELQFYSGRNATVAALAEAHRLGMPFSTSTMNGAAYSGELSTVIWLNTVHECAFNADTTTCSARRGHIEVLRWLKQQGAAFDAGTMFYAALHGQQLACAYLRAEGCDWDEAATYGAAFNCHWGTVRWLHEQGCPWVPKQMCLKAAQQGDISSMTYLSQHEESVPSYVLSDMLNAAGSKGHLAAVQWLRQQHGAEWPRALCHLGVQWSGNTLEWARAEGCDSPLELNGT